MPEIAFRVSPRAMRMIGRQNVSSQFVAINELVKNAYDADSPNVILEFKGDTREGPKGKGFIILSDNGTGMDLETISAKWLTIGTDNKEQEPISKKGRIRTGAKGIGRFALDRLGELSVIETFYDIEKPGIRITIDWNKYNDFAAGFESVKHNYEYIENSDKVTGTKIIVYNIRDVWDEEHMQELYEDLSFLIPPLQSEHMKFSIQISSDDFPGLNGSIEPTAHDNPEFLLESKMLADGYIEHHLYHKSGEEKIFKTRWQNLFDPPLLFPVQPSCGPAQVTLRIFIGPEGKKITTVNVKDTAFKKYLKSFRGIRIYRDGFLVKPYGLKNNDWLGLAPRKIRQNQGVVQADLGDYRFSNHQIIGKVDISRIENPQLEDRTSREGLIDNNAFKDLKRYLMECISYVELQRQIVENSKSQLFKEDAPRDVIEKIKRKPRKSSSNIPPSPKSDVKLGDPFYSNGRLESSGTIHDNYDQDLERVIEASEKLINENDMLRTLSTIGISAITLSHELKGDLLSLNAAQKIIDIELRRAKVESEVLKDEMSTLYASSSRMEAWADLILKRTQIGRRKEVIEYIDPFIRDIIQNFSKSSEGQNFSIDYRVEGESQKLLFRPIDLEAVIINLISNSIKALKRSSNYPKKINVIVAHGSSVKITVEDSGTGIRRHNTLLDNSEINTIFNPLVSFNNEDGTGMGLAIVDAICKDNNWSIDVVTLNQHGGATFTVILLEENNA